MVNLTAVKVRSLKQPGRYTDGRGLMLVIGKDGSRKWVLRIQYHGRRRDIGLGAEADVSLADARDAAHHIRQQVRQGLDPVAERKRARSQIPTFKEAALAVHNEHLPSWKNPKHSAQWLSTLERYVFPKIGSVCVNQIDGPMVRDVLAEIWLTIPETARRVRQRIGTVLDWAHAKGYRSTETPTRSIARGLPKQPKNQEHLAALPWPEVPSFIQRLRADNRASDVVKLAFEFMILTAARSGEMRGARWSEIDVKSKTWTIPGNRMKGGRQHIVPLSGRAIEILNRMAMARREGQDLVFEGAKVGKPMSDMTLTMLLRRMELKVTAHGFRSSFRDWSAEATNFPRELAESALAHVFGSKVEQSYFRSDLLERRKDMMDEWASFLCKTDT